MKNSAAINPWPTGNPALSLWVARTMGTPLKSQKKFLVLIYRFSHILEKVPKMRLVIRIRTIHIEWKLFFRSGRYRVSTEEYPAEYYEPYCSGGGFILSQPLVDRMIPLFQWEHPLRIDDAYIGGRVIAAGGGAEHGDGFLMWNTGCRYQKGLLVTHPADESCMRKLQGKIPQRKGRAD